MKEQGKESFERVAEHLYKRQYQTAGGEWRSKFYGIFTDWTGKRRKFALGTEIKAAKDALALYQARNVKREAFDSDKAKVLTLAEWLVVYLDLVKSTPSSGTKQAQCAHLKRLLGHLTLSEITRVRIMEYKNRRLAESLIRHGEAVQGTLIKGATVNREVSCLITALNLAADQGLCEGAPKIKKERETARERILTNEEYKALLDASPRWLQRIVVAANESAIDQGVLLKLTWDCIQDGLIVVKGGRAKTGAKQRVGISPALDGVLAELRRNTGGCQTLSGASSREAGSRSRKRRCDMHSIKLLLRPRLRIFNSETSGTVHGQGGSPRVYRMRSVRWV